METCQAKSCKTIIDIIKSRQMDIAVFLTKNRLKSTALLPYLYKEKYNGTNSQMTRASMGQFLQGDAYNRFMKYESDILYALKELTDRNDLTYDDVYESGL